MTKRKYTKIDLRRLQTMHVDGMTASKIAEELGASQTGVSKALRRLLDTQSPNHTEKRSVPRRKRDPLHAPRRSVAGNKLLTIAQTGEAIYWREKGRKMGEIAKLLGVSRLTVLRSLQGVRYANEMRGTPDERGVTILEQTPRVVTDATKAKLPLPANHPQKRKRGQTGGAPRKRREKPEPLPSLVDRHLERTPSPIAGQSLDGIGSAPLEKGSWCHQLDNGCGSAECVRTCGPAPDFRAIPCGEDNVTGGQGVWNTAKVTLPYNPWEGTDAPTWSTLRVPPPDTSAYPWPLKFAWWLDGWLAKLARRFA